jgi:hypothetical protein
MWYRKRKEKTKKKEPTLEPTPLRILTFAITLATMALGLSLMPLFPQPLPILLAFLVAFVTFKKPRFGMPIGTLLIGLGLMYQLATINFIAMLGEPLTRAAVVVVFVALFVILPFIFHSYKQAIAINMGIIAAILLFFNQTYYLAIPLILTAAVLFKKSSGLTITYYVLMSVPLLMMQYLKFILQIERVDWWIEPGASPPIYVPLTSIFQDIQQSMIQFRLYDTSKVVYAIVDQVTSTPAPARLNLGTVLSQYLDSIPGILLFLAIVIGAVFAIALVARFIVKGSASEIEKLLPVFTAASATAIFFLFVSALQGSLAFRADINGAQMAIGTVVAALLTLPAAFVDYSPKKKATIEMIMEKAQELMTKLQSFEVLLNEVKNSIPVTVSATEAKMLIIKDRLNDTLSKTSEKSYDASELDKKFNELEPGISNEIDNLISELNVTLGEYQVYVNCEYSTWIGKFKDIGLEVEATAKTDFQKEIPVEIRVERIKEVLEGGRLLANEVIKVTEQIYETVRSLYDPNLPEESQTIAFAKQKLDEKTPPWLALDALFTALNNWNRQYGAEISKSRKSLQNSLTPIANLSTQGESLLPVLGDNLSRLMDNAKRAENIKIGIEEKPLSIMNVLTIRDTLQSLLSIAREVLSILYEELKSKEEAIENLLPTTDYLWEKNVTLKKRMTTAMEIICDSEKHKLNQVMENLPKALFDIDECVETLTKYSEKKELLLNYPIAEIAIEELLRQKKQIAAQDLPFEPKYAEEYLRLFYSQRYSEFSFDDAGMLLMRRA